MWVDGVEQVDGYRMEAKLSGGSWRWSCRVWRGLVELRADGTEATEADARAAAEAFRAAQLGA